MQQKSDIRPSPSHRIRNQNSFVNFDSLQVLPSTTWVRMQKAVLQSITCRSRQRFRQVHQLPLYQRRLGNTSWQQGLWGRGIKFVGNSLFCHCLRDERIKRRVSTYGACDEYWHTETQYLCQWSMTSSSNPPIVLFFFNHKKVRIRQYEYVIAPTIKQLQWCSASITNCVCRAIDYIILISEHFLFHFLVMNHELIIIYYIFPPE